MRRRGGLWPPAGAPRAPLRMVRPCRARRPGAPWPSPWGKVARPQAVTDEGATDRFVLGGHTGPPLRAATGRNFRRGGPVWLPNLSLRHLLRKCRLPRQREAFQGEPAAGPSPWGEGGPVRTLGRMRGRREGRLLSTESPSHRLAAATAPFDKEAGRTLCAPTERTSLPEGLIRLAALGTFP